MYQMIVIVEMVVFIASIMFVCQMERELVEPEVTKETKHSSEKYGLSLSSQGVMAERQKGLHTKH